MKRVYDVWQTTPIELEGKTGKFVSLWLVERKLREVGLFPYNGGLLVCPLRTGLRCGSSELMAWQKWAHRAARAWNALRLAAELCDMLHDTLVGILMDRLDELDEGRLWQLLEDSFDRWYPVVWGRGVTPRIPDAPPRYDHERGALLG